MRNKFSKGNHTVFLVQLVVHLNELLSSSNDNNNNTNNSNNNNNNNNSNSDPGTLALESVLFNRR